MRGVTSARPVPRLVRARAPLPFCGFAGVVAAVAASGGVTVPSFWCGRLSVLCPGWGAAGGATSQVRVVPSGDHSNRQLCQPCPICVAWRGASRLCLAHNRA